MFGTQQELAPYQPPGEPNHNAFTPQNHFQMRQQIPTATDPQNNQIMKKIVLCALRCTMLTLTVMHFNHFVFIHALKLYLCEIFFKFFPKNKNYKIFFFLFFYN